jgi:6-phosphogluconate dehydrogenase
MATEVQKIGLVGLGVMGENLALNIEEKGFPIAVFNRSWDKTEEVLSRAKGKKFYGYKTPEGFVRAIERPRKIIMLVKAGKAVDDTIATLTPYLSEGDMLIDGGNEYFTHTERRAAELEKAKLRFVGMGVSGGEEGARHGPSLMPGGQRSAYDELAPILTKVAAQVDDGPCVDYIGPGGSGHYVKMVHNGIEYGDMQLIAEAYDILKRLGGLDNEQISAVFKEWNAGELQSFLIEITWKVLLKKDADSGNFLVDVIKDSTGSKGTGKWTIEEAAELQAPVPTMSESLEARYMSSLKAERVAAAKILHGPANVAKVSDTKALVDDVRHALYASKITSYAQGMNMLRAASRAYNWGLQLGRLARIWKGGCIIRAQFLDRITKAYQRDEGLANLMVDGEFAKELNERQGGWRRTVTAAINAGIAVPTIGASLAYFDSYRTEKLPANLTQAQRDFFGAHTFQRLDKGGTFHADWSDVGKLK